MAEKKTPDGSLIKEKLKSVVSDYEAGIPTDSQVRWVNLSPAKIQRKMETFGEEISYYLTCSMLKELGYRKRRYSKEQSLSEPANRDAQFNKIANLKKAFSEQGLPVLSIDTKQKEMLGNFDRGESYYGKEKRRTFDHDFLSHASGIVVPTEFMTASIIKDTSPWEQARTPPSLCVITSSIIGKTICSGFIPMHKVCLFCAMVEGPIPVGTIL